jgi:hypothetical protein
VLTLTSRAEYYIASVPSASQPVLLYAEVKYISYDLKCDEIWFGLQAKIRMNTNYISDGDKNHK